jgi:hypothetical protein
MMTQVPVFDFEKDRQNELESLKEETRNTVHEHTDTREMTEQVFKVLREIFSPVGCTPRSVGCSEVWAGTVDGTTQDRVNLCKALKGKSLFSAL